MNEPLDYATWWGGSAMLIVLLSLLIWLTDRIARQEGRHQAMREAALRERCRDGYEYTKGKCDGIRECAAWMQQHGYLPPRTPLPASLLERRRAEGGGRKQVPYAYCCNGDPAICDCVNPHHGTAQQNTP